jgi:micrococcal nuclease
MKQFNVVLLAIVLLIPSCAFIPQTYATPRTSCKVLKVIDGDTIRVNCGGNIERIRFCGTDSPEKKQPLGNKSTAFLKQLLSNGKVDIVAIESDRYGRTVAELFVGNTFINGEMVKAGLAYEYKQYSGKCPNRQQISNAEAIAQKNKVGVWDGKSYQLPWDFRRANRER